MLRRLWLLTASIHLILLAASSHASEREQALKAGFLYNFARYSEGDWFKSETESHYIICSTSESFTMVAKEVLKEQKIKSLPVLVEYITSPNNHCHSLFVSDDYQNINGFILNESFKNTMLIGEGKGFLNSGGHINFFIAGGKVRFEVSPKQLKKAKIKMSSKVLRMGRIVE